MVLLDSSSPGRLTVYEYADQYAADAAWPGPAPDAGSSRGQPPTRRPPGSPGAAGDVAAVTSTTPRAFRNGRDELATIPDVFEQAQALTTLRNLPLVVAHRLGEPRATRVDRRAGRAAALSTDHVHRAVDSTHEACLGERPARPSRCGPSLEVLSAARTGSPLAAD